MALPEGFQPRECKFCGCRVIVNAEFEPGIFWTVCTFCGGQGPRGSSNDEAWMAWNGLARKAPASEVVS